MEMIELLDGFPDSVSKTRQNNVKLERQKILVESGDIMLRVRKFNKRN